MLCSILCDKSAFAFLLVLHLVIKFTLPHLISSTHHPPTRHHLFLASSMAIFELADYVLSVFGHLKSFIFRHSHKGGCPYGRCGGRTAIAGDGVVGKYNLIQNYRTIPFLSHPQSTLNQLLTIHPSSEPTNRILARQVREAPLRTSPTKRRRRLGPMTKRNSAQPVHHPLAPSTMRKKRKRRRSPPMTWHTLMPWRRLT